MNVILFLGNLLVVNVRERLEVQNKTKSEKSIVERQCLMQPPLVNNNLLLIITGLLAMSYNTYISLFMFSNLQLGVFRFD